MSDRFLLDTTTLIDVLRGRNRRRELFAGIIRNGDTLTTSAINVGEVYAGSRTTELRQTEAFLMKLECFPITAGIARSAGEMKASWSRKGISLSLADMMVAATAMHHGLVLITDNTKDFSRLDLNLFQFPEAAAAE